MLKLGNCYVTCSKRSSEEVYGTCKSGDKEIFYVYNPVADLFYTGTMRRDLVKESEISVMVKAIDHYLVLKGVKRGLGGVSNAI